MTGILYPGGLGLLRAGIGDRTCRWPSTRSARWPTRASRSTRPACARPSGRWWRVAFHAFAEQPWRLEGLDRARCASRPRAYIAAVDAGPRRPSAATRRCTAATWSRWCSPRTRRSSTPRTSRASPSPGTAAQLRERAEALAADGVDELAIQPGGDVADGLRRLAAALIPGR